MMQGRLKEYQHAPAHLFLDDICYFFTRAVFEKQCLLIKLEVKEIFIEKLF